MALNTSTMALWTDLRTLISDRKSIVTLSNNFGNEHKISSSVYKTNSAFEIVRNHCVVVNVIAFGFKSINLLKQPKANENLLEMFYATIRRPGRPPRNLVPVDITTIKHRFKLSKTMWPAKILENKPKEKQLSSVEDEEEENPGKSIDGSRTARPIHSYSIIIKPEDGKMKWNKIELENI